MEIEIMKFQVKNIFNGSRDTAEKILYVQEKCPQLLSYRNEFHLASSPCVENARYKVSGKYKARRDTVAKVHYSTGKMPVVIYR
jgi:hypothetical protein